MNSNKNILKYCPNYYNIVNYSFNEDDTISDKIINIYKNYIFSVNVDNIYDVKKIEELDRVISNYISDYIFRNELQAEIVQVRVKKDNNILDNIVNIILNIFNKYVEYTTRKIYISRWI